MQRETSLQWARWFYTTANKRVFYGGLGASCFLHAVILCFLLYTTPKDYITSSDVGPTHLTMDLKEAQRQEAQSPRSSPLRPSQPQPAPSAKSSQKIDSAVPRLAPLPRSSTRNLSSFLPRSEGFVPHSHDAQHAQKNSAPLADDPYRPQQKIVERFSTQDRSLYQFTQIFRERFAAIWNSEERLLPPTSALRPGDIVYYKIYILPSGKLDHYENITQPVPPQGYDPNMEKIFQSVILQVFPLSVPGRYKDHQIITEIIAINVVGPNSPMRFNF